VLLRDITSIVAQQMRASVSVIDNEMELAGNQSVAHKCIGRSRRLPATKEDQHLMINEACTNYNARLVVIDDITAATIDQLHAQGVRYIATIRGNGMPSLLNNDSMMKLIKRNDSGASNTIVICMQSLTKMDIHYHVRHDNGSTKEHRYVNDGNGVIMTDAAVPGGGSGDNVDEQQPGGV
jgi:stage III sporulation protein SpoIIIAA